MVIISLIERLELPNFGYYKKAYSSCFCRHHQNCAPICEQPLKGLSWIGLIKYKNILQNQHFSMLHILVDKVKMYCRISTFPSSTLYTKYYTKSYILHDMYLFYCQKCLVLFKGVIIQRVILLHTIWLNCLVKIHLHRLQKYWTHLKFQSVID